MICKHTWQQHVTSYRCGIDEYHKTCKKCKAMEKQGVYDQEKKAWIDSEENRELKDKVKKYDDIEISKLQEENKLLTEEIKALEWAIGCLQDGQEKLQSELITLKEKYEKSGEWEIRR